MRVVDVLGAPHVGKQLPMRDDAAAAADEARQQGELGRRQVNGSTVALDPPVVEIDRQPVALDVAQGRLERRAAMAKRDANARAARRC